MSNSGRVNLLEWVGGWIKMLISLQVLMLLIR